MALWHFLVRNARGLWVPDGKPWDDGRNCRPGDDAFSSTPAKDRAGERLPNYIGTPNWQEV